MAESARAKLSASLEDYIEAIFNLIRESQVARSKDIAKRLGVSRSSVTGALRLLREKGLANYEPYDYVTLTESGRAAAEEVVRKHNALKSFFEGILGIEPQLAHEAACRAEHTLGSEIIARLILFIEFVRGAGENGLDVVERFRQFCKADSTSPGQAEPTGAGVPGGKPPRRLSEVEAGQRVRIVRIEAGRDLNSRLAAMGLTRDVEISVISNSRGGPFVVAVKDSKVMLGRRMTEKILVQ